MSYTFNLAFLWETISYYKIILILYEVIQGYIGHPSLICMRLEGTKYYSLHGFKQIDSLYITFWYFSISLRKTWDKKYTFDSDYESFVV